MLLFLMIVAVIWSLLPSWKEERAAIEAPRREQEARERARRLRELEEFDAAREGEAGAVGCTKEA
jgi:hypothetical protein